MNIHVLIVDDEKIARNRVRKLLNEIPEVTKITDSANGSSAIKKLSENTPDIVILDIQLRDMNSFQVLDRVHLKNPPHIVFATAFDEFAIKAFEISAVDYLQKPFNDERFFEAMKKALTLVKSQNKDVIQNNLNKLLAHFPDLQSHTIPQDDRIPIKTGTKITFVYGKDIKYIIASGYYSEIHTTEKKQLLRESLANLILKLNSAKFVRIHRSFIVNTDFITEVTTTSYGDLNVKMFDSKIFRVSKSYRKDFMDKMGI
ncbi:LytR/AlgR family response regulator transcription factor [Flagellimonas aequoris]|uniref:DNA-binding response regulator n=1 Tax=Flagellimonas aequoris TaxID=2306997 RepID=A0A418N979_9FLAO|nr:LytTR family DNA-binding domain-containing protein [Allomuricauda aequoris]RIV71546.1 DNA-binding response regulator [Allomuricauda aequoris]TXK03111.1 response regulator transcription factor [Allomuricauda aequoris]